jgi:hypothetical protein
MKKYFKIVLVVIFSAVIGAGIFSFIIAQELYFPEVRQVVDGGGAGLRLTAYQYKPWLWNRKKITIININDWKNDAPSVEYKLKGEVYSIRSIHSGEDFALIAYSDPNFSSMESGYIVHRSPKAEGENTIEEIHIGGNIIAVAPDESGIFYISQGKIFKQNWQGDTMMSNDLGVEIEPILDVYDRPVLFFSNNTKMAFWGTTIGERWSDGYLFIWDLENNKMEKISRQDYADYGDLIIEDDKLYVGRTDCLVSKKLIAE